MSSSVSKEEDLSNGHTPLPNGYDLGRYVHSTYFLDAVEQPRLRHIRSDEIVSSAVNSSSYDGVTFNATVEDITGLLNNGTVMNGTIGINHS